MSYTWCSLEAVQQRVALDCLSLHFRSTERQASRTAALVAALENAKVQNIFVVLHGDEPELHGGRKRRCSVHARPQCREMEMCTRVCAHRAGRGKCFCLCVSIDVRVSDALIFRASRARSGVLGNRQPFSCTP